MKKQRHRINVCLFLSWEEGKYCHINHEKTNHTQIKNMVIYVGEKGGEWVRGTKMMDAYIQNIYSFNFGVMGYIIKN